MVSAEVFRTVLGVIGNVISFFLFLSPSKTFYGIYKKKSIEDFSPVPYLATVVNCALWVYYGMPFVHPHSLLVVTINGIGLAIELIYVFLFLIYSDKKMRLRTMLILLAEAVCLAFLIALVSTLVHTTTLRSTIVGTICIVGNVAMYASPLSVMKMVITTKSVEYMPFLLSLCCFVNGLCWLCYGLIDFDINLVVPNGLGAVSGLIQLILYATYYKPTKRLIAVRQRNNEISMGKIEDMKPSVEWL